MKHDMFIFILLITITQLQYNLGLQYDYDGPNGPQTWAQTWPSCGGNAQSPINIITSQARNNQKVSALTLSGFAQSVSYINITNRESKVDFHLNASRSNLPQISGGFLNATYHFVAVYIHWGKNNSVGSEHQINGHSYSMELDFVFIKNGYNTLPEAVQHEDGVVAITNFVKISKSNNKYYDCIIKALPSIQNDTSSKIVDVKSSFTNLLPPEMTLYYFYRGSATIPKCPTVSHIVMKDYIFLSSEQVEAFRQLYDPHGNNILNNLRPIQPLNGRVVQFSTKISVC